MKLGPTIRRQGLQSDREHNLCKYSKCELGQRGHNSNSKSAFQSGHSVAGVIKT